MRRRLHEADTDLARWLDWVSARSRALTWMVSGEQWFREAVGEPWLVEREEPELRDLRRDGRAPLVIDGDTLDAIVETERAKPSQGDIDDALRGLPQVEVEDPMGGTRIDYPHVPLKNADGSLSRYAKNIIDLHAPAAREGEEAGWKLREAVADATQVVER